MIRHSTHCSNDVTCSAKLCMSPSTNIGPAKNDMTWWAITVFAAMKREPTTVSQVVYQMVEKQIYPQDPKTVLKTEMLIKVTFSLGNCVVQDELIMSKNCHAILPRMNYSQLRI